jgi:DNA polymerase-3 subunit epsilon
VNLTRPIAFLDIESTGLDPVFDRIIDLAVVKFAGSFEPLARHSFRVNPGIPIPAAATAIHGISNADVADCQTFNAVAPMILAALEGCDLGGFNITGFDLAILSEEFHRAGIQWDAAGARIVDANGIFRRMEPRNLSAAVRKYCWREHEGAHGALSDCVASADVLVGQIKAYPELQGMDFDALAAFSTEREFDGLKGQPVDLAGKLVRTSDGVVRYTFGKAKGVPVLHDQGFAHWILARDFTENTKRCLKAILYPAREGETQDEADGEGGVENFLREKKNKRFFGGLDTMFQKKM